MNTSTESNPPKLQKPGAGLPLLQRIALKAWFGPFVSKRTPRAETKATYELITKKLIEVISKVPAELRNQKVLIEPLIGLEDSSRYWSLNGVMEHLMIVSKGVEGGILLLSSGKVPDIKPDTATVKPKHQDHDYLAEFIEYAPQLISRLDQKLLEPGMNFDSPLKLAHPWFGPFTARQWYWLLASHQGIHYQQAKRIIRGLKA